MCIPDRNMRTLNEVLSNKKVGEVHDMKKLIITALIVLTITVGIILIINMKQEVGISTVKTLTPVESFGNQMNRMSSNGYNYVLDGDWFYEAKWHNKIVRYKLAHKVTSQTIFSTTGDWTPCNVTAYNDWIYFTLENMAEGGDIDLYRVRENGSGKRKLLNGGDDSNNYVLTEEGLVYIKNGSIYIMNLDGTNKRKIPSESSANSLAINNNWIYFYSSQSLYKMKPDGSKLENVPSFDYLEQEAWYHVENSEKKGKDYLYRTTNEGKDTLLAEMPVYGFRCINIEGDWLYFANDNKVYKMKKTGEGKKELIYRMQDNEQVDSILLYDGNVLISTTHSKSVYIKKDGEVLNLE